MSSDEALLARYTEGARRVLELALREALSLGHNYIGTEHLLLALARGHEGIGTKVLTAHGLDEHGARQAVVSALVDSNLGPRVRALVDGYERGSMTATQLREALQEL